MFVIAISIARYASRTINIRDLPLSGKLQSDFIQLEHRTPGVGVENGITPCRLSACSMLSRVEATLVGASVSLPSQYCTDRGWHPVSRARSACVSPASIRAARIWRPETMLLMACLHKTLWFKQALCVAAPANVPQQVSIAFSGSRQHSAKHREVHIATGEDQADTFPLHAVALLEQCRQRCGASPLRDIVSVGEQIARAASISSSETVTTRSAPSQIDSSASTMGTRQAMPSAIVSAELVDTGRR